MKKRLVSLLMALALCLSLLPAMALAVDAPATLYVGNQQVINGNNTTFWTTDKSTGGLTEYEGNDDNWNVKYDPSTVTLTLKNATIEGEYDDVNTSGAGIYAASSSGPVSLNIVLEEENKVSGWYGINVSSGGDASLNISGSGSLTVSGLSGNGIGIFMSSQNSANLTIEEASVTALGSQVGGSGVRLITSQTGSPSLTIEVKGGSLQASGETNGIHFLSNVNDATAVANLKVSGNAMVKASSITTTKDGTGSAPELKPAASGSDGTGGIIWDGKNGTVYGNVTLQEDLEIAEGENLTIGENASLTVPEGKTLTNNGTVTTEEGGTLTNNGSLDCNHHFGGTATCTEKAKCDLCGAEFGDFLPHSLTKTEAKAPTCTEEGNEAYWTCGTCGKYFSDASGDTEIAKDSWILSPIGHDWNDAVYTWSDDGSTCTATRTCKHDSAHTETAGATVTPAQTKAPTCTQMGETTYTAVFAADWAMTQTKVLADIPATGHTLTKTEAKAPTCTEAGNKEYWTCKTCGKCFSDAEGKVEITQADTVIPAAGHKLTKTEAKAPTCTEVGNEAYWTCETCGKFFADAEGKVEITLDSTVLPALGHDYKDGVCTRCEGKDPDYVPPTDPEAPAQTGETAQVGLWFFLMTVSMASIAVMTVLRRQKHRA